MQWYKVFFKAVCYVIIFGQICCEQKIFLHKIAIIRELQKWKSIISKNINSIWKSVLFDIIRRSSLFTYVSLRHAMKSWARSGVLHGEKSRSCMPNPIIIIHINGDLGFLQTNATKLCLLRAELLREVNFQTHDQRIIQYNFSQFPRKYGRLQVLKPKFIFTILPHFDIL